MLADSQDRAEERGKEVRSGRIDQGHPVGRFLVEAENAGAVQESGVDQDPAFKAAFDALTPGRQREYNLYISDAKQAKTRMARVQKYARKILDGKGFRDR